MEQTFGRPVFTAKDCIQLSADIYNRTKIQISSNTLRRLFGLIKATNAPSKSTLNILAKYCGFYSLSDVPKAAESTTEIEAIPRESILNFLFSLFDEVPLQEMKKETLLVLMKNLIHLLNREEELAHAFQRKVAKSSNGQTLYFERFINLDKLNNYYGDGLRYYMHEKKTIEAECVGYSLLVFRYWLSLEDEKLEHSMEQLRKNYPYKAKNIFVVSRYYAARLFDAHVKELPMEVIIEEAHKFHLSVGHNQERKQGFPFFEYVVSMALLLTGNASEALYYVNHASEMYIKDPFYDGLGQYYILLLIKGIACAEVGEKLRAERIFNGLNTSEFSILSKKFATILYLLLATKLKKRIHRKEELLEALVLETGFLRFNTLIHSI